MHLNTIIVFCRLSCNAMFATTHQTWHNMEQCSTYLCRLSVSLTVYIPLSLDTTHRQSRQSIWHNSNIQKDNKCIIYKEWEDKNIQYIQDLLHMDGNLLSKTEIENKYDITCKQLDYESLIHAIPKA